ncbi:MAG: hypothetical protein ACKOTZ_07985 [Chloroflexota bacterium]
MSRTDDPDRMARKAARKAERQARRAGAAAVPPPAAGDAAGATPPGDAVGATPAAADARAAGATPAAGAAPADPGTPSAATTARPVDPAVARAQAELALARAELGLALDGAVDAGKAAADPRTWVRRDPVRTAALAGGAGFLALGGPRRVLRAAGRLLPRRGPSGAGLLPDEVERVLRDSGLSRDPKVRAALERDFADYLRRKGRVRREPGAATSFWRTYDALVGPIGRRGAQVLVARLFDAGRKDDPRA